VAARAGADAQDLQGHRQPPLPGGAVRHPEVLALKNDFFSGGPVGEIFTGTAESLQPQYLGSKNGPVRQAVESVIKLVEQGKQAPDAGWSKAVEDAKRAAA
jgi:cellobiose transport system substrate-binding protein